MLAFPRFLLPRSDPLLLSLSTSPDVVILAQTFQVKCGDNADVATQMFDALRAEMQRIDKLQKDLRKDKRTLTQGQRDRDYWKKPLDHGQVNRTT